MAILLDETGAKTVKISEGGQRLLAAEQNFELANELVKNAMVAHIITQQKLNSALSIRDEARRQFVTTTRQILKEAWI